MSARSPADIRATTAKLRDRLDLMLTNFAKLKLSAPQQQREFQQTLHYIDSCLEGALGPLPPKISAHLVEAAKYAGCYNAGCFVRAVDTALLTAEQKCNKRAG